MGEHLDAIENDKYDDFIIDLDRSKRLDTQIVVI